MNGQGVLCNRSVWECPNTGVWFTVPSLTKAEIDALYRFEYSGQARLNPNSPRISAQFSYVKDFILENANYARTTGERTKFNFLEIGCASGYLLKKLAPYATELTCFEPSPHFATAAEELLLANNTDLPTRVFPSNWNAELIAPSSVDVFLSSHVLEHIPDLCTFFSELFEKMKPGGAVFSEVPNHNTEYIATTFGGQFHVTLFDARGWILMMENSGFQLMHLTKTGENELATPNGIRMRSIFTKPRHPAQDKVADFKGMGW